MPGSSSQPPNPPPPTDNAPRPTNIEFRDVPYSYEVMVPWTSDASHYRDKDQLAYRQRLMNGFIPVSINGSDQPLTGGLRKSPTPSIGTRAEKGPGADYGSSTTGDLSALVDSASIDVSDSGYLNTDPSSSKSVQDIADLSSAFTTDAISADSPEWSLGLLSDVKDAPSCDFQDGASRGVTFVSFNPLELSADATRQKRGPFRNDQLREETNKTRQLKACVRCRMQKTRVSPAGIVGDILRVVC